jgi:hypothetical protein
MWGRGSLSPGSVPAIVHLTTSQVDVVRLRGLTQKISHTPYFRLSAGRFLILFSALDKRPGAWHVALIIRP